MATKPKAAANRSRLVRKSSTGSSTVSKKSKGTPKSGAGPANSQAAAAFESRIARQTSNAQRQAKEGNVSVMQKKGKMAVEKKELMRAMAVVEGLQKQMSEEGSKRQRMMSKMKKEQKKAKLMCEILKEQKALLIEDNSSSGESSEVGDSDSQSRDENLLDLEVGVRKLEQEIAERNIKLDELECMGEKFQADADMLRRTVNDTVQSLGAQGLETTQTRKDIENLRKAVEQSLKNFRTAEEEREIKWHHQQKASEDCFENRVLSIPVLRKSASDLVPLLQVRDEFFLARLQDVETRAVAAERELFNVAGGVDLLEAQIGTARATLLSAPKYNSGVQTATQGSFQTRSPHNHRDGNSQDLTQSDIRQDIVLPSKRCSACVNMEARTEGTVLEGNSAIAPVAMKEERRADFRLSPHGGLPSPSNQGSPGGWSDVPERFCRSPEDSPRDRDDIAVPVLFRVPTHPNDRTGGTVQNRKDKGGEHGHINDVNGKKSVLPEENDQLVLEKSASAGCEDLLGDSSTLAKEDLVNKLEQFARTLKNIEAQNDTRISCVEADWRARLLRVEAKLSESLKVQDDAQRKMKSSEERVKDLEDVVKAKDEAIAQLSLLSLESRCSPDTSIQHLISENASTTLQATEALHALELENHDLRENLTEAHRREQDFVQRVHDMTQENDALSRYMNHAQVEMQDTESAREKWKNRAEFLEVEVHKLKAALSEAERQLKSVRTDLSNVQTTDPLSMTRDAELEVLQRHVEALTSKLDRKCREIVGLKNENAHLLADVKASKKRLDVLEEEKEVTRVVDSGWQGPSMAKAEQTENLSKLRSHLRQNAEAMMEASKNLAFSMSEKPAEKHSPCISRIGKLESELIETRGQLRDCDLRLKLASAELSNRKR